MCASPHCPDSSTGLCTETNCPNNYYETLFDNHPEPWFNYGASCTDSKDIPSNTYAIYKTKEDCCSEEYGDNASGCMQRTAAVLEYSFFGKVRLVGMNCPNNGSERAAAAGIMARSILDALCSISGVACNAKAKIAVTKFCGYDFNVEAQYSPDSRRLLSTATVDEDVVEFLFTMEALDSTTLETLAALLSSYLSGTTVSAFTAAVLSNVLSNNPTPSLAALTGVFYTAVAAFIQGLGLYYPAWGTAETCLSVSDACLSIS